MARSIGLTVEGSLDFVHDQVDMSGTFVPVYAFNNLFAKIPVFGLILAGGTNEGLIGVNYRITGLASAPTLNINPLSAIAPGIFRQIFGVASTAIRCGRMRSRGFGDLQEHMSLFAEREFDNVSRQVSPVRSWHVRR